MSLWFGRVCNAVSEVLRGNRESARRSKRGSASVLGLEARVFLSAKAAPAAVIANTAARIREDAFEDNDTFGAANDRGTIEAATQITGALYDDDWFKFSTTRPGQIGDFVGTTFTHSNGDLDLELYNAGGALLGRSESISNTEELSLQGLAGGTYFVRVYGFQGATNRSYTLKIDPPSPPTDDAFENNDTLGTAHNFGTLTAPRNISNLALLDQDYFQFTTTQMGTEASFVSVGFNNNAGDVDLYLYNSNGTEVGFSASFTQNYERISLNGLPAGTYTIQVTPFPSLTTNPSYDLSIAPPNSMDGEHTLYLNFDGYNISRNELVQWNNGEWLEGSDDFLDPELNGIIVAPFLANRAEREQVITQMLSMVATDLAPFGMQVVRHFGPAVTNQEATTIFLGPSSHGLHVADDIDYGNINQTDIAFVGDEWWGSAGDTAIALADVTLHEAGHTFGLYHVVSGKAVETMGLRYNNPQTKWVKNTAFLNKTFHILPGHGPNTTQNSFNYMRNTFVLGAATPSQGLFVLNQSAVISGSSGLLMVTNRNRDSVGIL